ncbi:MAG: AIM24 family protein, partial [Anaerotignaceae bacterium]
MNYEIQGGSLPVALCKLHKGETMVSEAGGRTWFKGNVETKTSGGGVGKMFSRAISGESIFLSEYTANSEAE